MRRETGAIAPIFRTDTRLPVNAALASNHRWEADADGLIRQIKSSPTIDLTDDIRARDPGTETA